MQAVLSRVVLLSFLFFCVGCAGEFPEGLKKTPAGSGPQVVWDVEHKPLPDIPFPNDFALRIDSSTPTGRRLNVSMVAPTEVEAEFRRRAQDLDGFSTFAPITVRFDALLDIQNIIDRQRGNSSPDDDVALVINISPESPGYGSVHPIDFGHGYFPGTIPDPHFYFDHDPRAGGASLIFETFDEDINQNGILDPGEDSDGDGVLDKPNVFPADGNPWDHLLTFYERESDTLILRPMVPLREATRYAVVLTRHLVDNNGEPIRSPFQFVSLAAQNDALMVLHEVLPKGLKVSDVAFAWSFTTQSVSRDLLTIRAGLYGHGSMSWLKPRYPATLRLDPVRSEPGERNSLYLVKGTDLNYVAQLLAASFGIDGTTISSMVESYDYISHIVWGRYTTPNFLVDRDGLATEYNPQDDDESWEIDTVTGDAVVADSEVTFVCAIPKALPGQSAPFPVVLHTTGTAAPKLAALGYAGYHARQGLATCAIDPFGQGFDIPEKGGFSEEMLQPILAQLGVDLIIKALEGNRARDLNNDGVPDSGGDFWSPDPFHSRDTVRQTVVDWLQFVRILRSFGSTVGTDDVNNDGEPDVLGDFDGDGKADIGTEAGQYSAWGISLGGIVTGVFAGVEPKLSAAVPQSGGGGLIDVAMRSLQQGVPEMVILGSWSQMIDGQPEKDGTVTTRLLVGNMGNVKYKAFGTLEGIQPGDTVKLTNRRSLEMRRGLVQADGGFRLAVASDALMPTEMKTLLDLKPHLEGFEPLEVEDTLSLGDPLEICVFAPDGTKRDCVDSFEKSIKWAGLIYAKGAPLVAIQRGLGLMRQTPDYRRLGAIAQTVLDRADPINYAAHYHMEPFAFDYDSSVTPGCNVLNLATVGDPNVPVATAVSLARAMGVLDADDMQVLVDNYVVEGMWRTARFRTDGDEQGPLSYDPEFDTQNDKKKSILFDVDDLDEGADPHGAPSPMLPLRATVEALDGGLAGFRVIYNNPQGSHGISPPDPKNDYSANLYGINLMTRYLFTGGMELLDDPCLAANDCSFIAPAVTTVEDE